MCRPTSCPSLEHSGLLLRGMARPWRCNMKRGIMGLMSGITGWLFVGLREGNHRLDENMKLTRYGFSSYQ